MFTDAWTAVLNGTVYGTYHVSPGLKLSTDMISFRFKTIKEDGVIFRTKSNSGDGYIEARLDGGQMAIDIGLGDSAQVRVFLKNIDHHENIFLSKVFPIFSDMSFYLFFCLIGIP